MNIQNNTSIHGEWSSRLAFIMAATGSAVGLGNIWKFPYITGENGGGAFVIIYLLCIFVICLPVMMAEVLLGRRGRHSPINSMRILAQESNRSPFWQLVGWSGVIAGFLILSYYSVVAGWALAYAQYLATGTFAAVNSLPPGEISGFVSSIFDKLTGDPWRLLFWHTIFMIMTAVVVAGGVKGGLERAVQFMMPALFLVLLVLLGYAMSTEKFLEGFHFLFDVNFKQFFYPGCGETETTCEFSGRGIFAALGQAFFTLSLGMGSIMVYGAYLSKEASIAQTTTIVAVADTMVAILAGLIIFPIVFSNQLEPGQGVGLTFNTLPIAFGQMPFGRLFGTLFFILLVIAAWSSAISLMEPAVAWLVETGKLTRVRAAIALGAVTWLVGLLTIFSFNILKKVTFWNKTWFDLIDYLTQNIMLPLGGLLIALFVAWFMKSQKVREELGLSADTFIYRIWRLLLRYVTPLGIGLIFLNAIGVFS